MRRREFLGIAATATGGLVFPPTSAGATKRVYLSSYTSSGGPGIGYGAVDITTGKLKLTGTADGGTDPSFLALAPGQRALYANNELVPDGLVTALSIGSSGQPTLLNQQPTGQGPVHVHVHPSGRYLVSSLYTVGQVVVHSLGADRRVGPVVDSVQHPTDPELGKPVVHQVVSDPNGGWLLACDLGLDSVFAYRLDLHTGKLGTQRRTQLAAGAGPRHLAFSPTGSYAYVANELDSTITTCRWHAASGVLTPIQTISTLLAPPPTRNYPAAVVVSPDGRYVYLSNRGDNSIAVFAVRPTGQLSLVATPSCGGVWPRSIALDPSGRWLFVGNQQSDEVVWFPRNASTGLLGAQAGSLAFTAVSCILFA
jgi:6-phosphogluconolactonase